MALYKLDTGKLNGIDIRNNQPILTISGNKIAIRLLDGMEFVDALLEEFIDDAGAPFATMAAFLAYWNTYYTKIPTSTTTHGTE